MNRVFFKIVLLICLTGATYAELPIASENDQKLILQIVIGTSKKYGMSISNQMIKSLIPKAIYTQLVEKMIDVNMGLDKTKRGF